MNTLANDQIEIRTTDSEIAAIADAICRLERWRANQLDIKERRKFQRQCKKQQQAESEPAA